MISTGNDIVALNHTNSERTTQKNFYSKIICQEEVELFNNSSLTINFEQFIWLAWSVKESVYKFYSRHNPDLNFSSAKIILKKVVEPGFKIDTDFFKQESISFNKEECFCCEINYADLVFYSRSFINDNLVFTVANNLDCFENICWGIKKIDEDFYETQSTSVRMFVAERLKNEFNKEVEIEKSTAGFPFIKNKEHIPLSFAHHGNFVAYSFLLNQ